MVVKVVTVFSLTNKKLLVKTINKYSKLILRLSTNRSRVSRRLRSFNNFVKLLFKIFQHHGSTYLVKYLKTSHIIIQQRISGKVIKSSRSIEPDLPLPRLISGLPCFINSVDRGLIKKGDTSTIKLWLSITNLYRVLDAPGKVKLETITNPFIGDLNLIKILTYEISEIIHFQVVKKRFEPYRGVNIKALQATKLLPLKNAGPNNKVAYHGILADAYALSREPQVIDAFHDYAIATKSLLNPGVFARLFDKAFDILDNKITLNTLHLDSKFDLFTKFDKENKEHLNNNIKTYYKEGPSKAFNLRQIIEEHTVNEKGKQVPNLINRPKTCINSAKLSFLKEAAGKVRVIAIVDIWTQSLLQPLHKALFRFLTKLPNDGTFDQDKSFHRVMEKSKLFGRAYSVDLSAATDRLPVLLQENILNCWFGNNIGTHWRKLLTLRNYYIDDSNAFVNINETPYVKYGCGQPMGCLSSWAMLAITHHMILQACAFRVYGTRVWFEDYEILGDDLVIFDTLIYEEYINIMQGLKVETNPSKSMISHNMGVAEFAKRTCYIGEDVSGLSWKQFISEDSMNGRITTLLSLGRKGLVKSVNTILTILLPEYINFDINKLSVKQKTILNASLINALSFFVHNKQITYEQAVASVVDPCKGGDAAIDCVIPVQQTLLNLKNLFDEHYKMYNPYYVSEKVDGGYHLSNYDKRKQVVLTDVLNNLVSAFMRDMNQKIYDFMESDKAQNERLIFDCITKDAFLYIKAVDPNFSIQLYFALESATVRLIDGDVDSFIEDWQERIMKYATEYFDDYSTMSKLFLDLREEVTEHIMSFDMVAKQTVDTKKRIKPFLMKDLITAYRL
jgi:hypothetical protein